MAGHRDEPLWRPSAERVRATRIHAFMRAAEREWAVEAGSYGRLHEFSLRQMERFWPSIWRFCGVRGGMPGERVLVEGGRMPGARFFPEGRLNVAESLLGREDESPALIFRGETAVRRAVSRAELHREVRRAARALHAAGVRPGDRVAAFVPNVPETVVAALATAALGAVWSSCSPDFGVRGVLDRFAQIGPKLLVAADGYFYNGRRHGSLERVRGILEGLPTVERAVVIPYTTEQPRLDGLDRAVLWPELLSGHADAPLTFEAFPFDHPLCIVFSSGTTGVPKCIVHRAGGVLLQHLKEHQLHCDVRPGDRVFYFTTCGWMMWNWLLSALASDATVLLYDGAPLYPDVNALFDFADETGMTLFGTSAKFIDAVRKAGGAPIRTHGLTALRTITSTGSPLAPEGFDFVYREVKSDVHLASISGGTDILGCFVGGDPAGPVWRGEIQVPALGMAVDVFGEDGRPVRGRRGELVCTAPFPSMPLGFWNDPGGERYRAAYFERFPGVWCHGDWAEITPRGGIVISGRSDAVLNPGGVRIGTAEIYRQAEEIDEVLESVAIGQAWEGDERIVLFVRLRPGCRLDEPLVDRIRDRIRRNASPRHVPARVVAVEDIPRTRSGKIAELAVRDVVHGRPVKNTEALANPESLELYRNRPELAT